MYDRIGFICEKTAGGQKLFNNSKLPFVTLCNKTNLFPEECLFDSVGFQNRCYVFNTEINRPSSSYYWGGNEKICQDLTMEMVVVETEVT